MDPAAWAVLAATNLDEMNIKQTFPACVLALFTRARAAPADPAGSAAIPKPNVVPSVVLGLLLLQTGMDAGETNSVPTDEAFAAQLARVRKQAPEGFTVVAQPPFVVVGDEPAGQVSVRATQTVKWAVDKLKQDYFKRDPEETITIWLFRDKESYEQHAKLLFNDTPTTPFGYYSSKQRALVMNIATGGGTLVHEIVHPFMRANFPECPAWFNEGLASLYEASCERQGRISGLINWRFKGLEQAIRAGKLPTFQKLTATTDAEFYGGEDSANYNQHYAQARYLCYYLQEKGLLVKYYREFVAKAKDDPTGYKTLQRVLGEKDMDAFQKKWEKFILGLRGG